MYIDSLNKCGIKNNTPYVESHCYKAYSNMYFGSNENIHEESRVTDNGDNGDKNNEGGYSSPLNVFRSRRYHRVAKVDHDLKGGSAKLQHSQSCRTSKCTNNCECEWCRPQICETLGSVQDHIPSDFRETEMNERDTLNRRTSHATYRRNIRSESGDIAETNDTEAEYSYVIEAEHHEGKFPSYRVSIYSKN